MTLTELIDRLQLILQSAGGEADVRVEVDERDSKPLAWIEVTIEAVNGGNNTVRLLA
jgi:hypothetical protein